MRYQEFLQRTYFTKHDLLASGAGTLIENPPEGGVARLPAPPFLMFDRITLIEKGSKGARVVAEQDIAADAWYFQCHFRADPVQPGCLGVDAIWQLLGFFGASMGAVGSGRALGCRGVEFFGQIRPFDELVRYELVVRRYWELKESGSAIAIADGTVFLRDTPLYVVKDAKVGIFRDIAYSDYPDPQGRHARGGLVHAHEVAAAGA